MRWTDDDKRSIGRLENARNNIQGGKSIGVQQRRKKFITNEKLHWTSSNGVTSSQAYTPSTQTQGYK